jgi:hypothetical protein
MNEHLADPVEHGRAWAHRQEEVFPEWVARYGGGDPGRWDFGLDSLNVLTYIIFDHFPTQEAIDDPDNAAFSEPAAWYLGEIVRRSDPKKLRWSRRNDGPDAGHYVVEPAAKTQRWIAENPQAHLGFVPYFGEPMWLRERYLDYIAPLWDKPWPPWIHSSETGRWSWDGAEQRWFSQLDQWLNGIADLLSLLAAELPDTALDYSTASLEAVEIFAVNKLAATQDLMLRAAVTAYVGECLLRTGGEKWIWDERPDRLTNGFPVVLRNVKRVSPTHLIEYAWARQDGQTFARIHRAWLAEDEGRRRRGHQALQREPTPGLDVMPEPRPIHAWVAHAAAKFPDWVARYGAGCRWDFSAESMDELARVVLDHCPAGTSLLDAPDGDAFISGVVWYFGETLHRAKPSHWGYNGSLAVRTGRGWDGPEIITNDTVFTTYGLSVFLMQELDDVANPRRRWEPGDAETNPKGLRDTYEHWVTASIRERIEGSQKRREQTKRRAGRRRSDDETLARWLAERTEEFPRWVHQFGPSTQWDFSIESLDSLEALIRHVAPGPEELLEDTANAAFLEGAAWYFGEVLRRADPDDTRWEYERRYHAEPHLSGWPPTQAAEDLATVYKADGGVLRRHYELRRRLKENRAERGQQI